MKIKPWIEAMRLRTLPVSAAGVVLAAALGVATESFRWLPWTLCLIFALLAQIASNFANEYYDFKAGLDRPGREGPRRGVTEGDITPRAMKIACYATLALAAAVGCSLIYYGGWWLIPVGAFIAVGALAYSAGPYPLSRHALGEVAVMLFFGVIPVNFTYYVMAGHFSPLSLWTSLAAGFMGANILIVNNYRDADDDAAVGKHTIATKFGRDFASMLYLLDGVIAAWMLRPLAKTTGWAGWVAIAIYLLINLSLWLAMRRRQGRALNPLLGITALNFLLCALLFLASALLPL